MPAEVATPADVAAALEQAKSYTDVRATSGGAASAVLDVATFGAKGDGSDDTRAIQSAIDEAEASGGPCPMVRLGLRHGISDELVVSRGVAVQGMGSRNTLVHHVNGYTGWLLTIFDAGRSGEWQAQDDDYTPARDLSGATVRGIGFNGLDRTLRRHGLRVLRADDLLLDDVTCGFLAGTALQVGAGPGDDIAPGAVRESELNRVKVFKSGDGPDVPAAVFQSAPTGSSDGTNQVYGMQFRFVYNHGGLVFRNDNPGEWVRRIQLDQVQLHGLTHGKTTGNITDHDLCTFEGGLINVSMTGVQANGSGEGRALWRVKPNAAGTRPVGINVAAAVSGCAGDAFVAEDVAALSLDLYSGGGIAGDLVRLDKASNYEVRLRGTGSYDPAKVKHPARGSVFWHGQQVS